MCGGGSENTNFTSFVFLWAAGFTNVAKDSRHVGVFGAKIGWNHSLEFYEDKSEFYPK